MPTAPLPGRRWIAGLLLFMGLNAVVAAFLFITEPDGSSIGIPQEWLAGSSFDDYLVPGLLLGSMGVLSLATAILQLRRNRSAWFAAGAVGLGFVVWIIVQSAMMGSFRHPMQTALQALVLTIAIVVSVLAFRQYRAWRIGP